MNIRGLSMTFVERTLFSDISFDVEKHDKIGFIGANGTGKTTLFRLICGELPASEGDIFISRGVRVGYMRQHVCADPAVSVYDALISVFSALTEAERELERLSERIDRAQESELEELVGRQTALLEQYERNGGLTYKSRAGATLIGLGFLQEDFSRPCGTLSGGQASKLSLARLLLSDSDFLLLDEPTNHLDIDSVVWLEQFIRDFPGTALIISHDRFFLDAVTNKTIELANCKITVYSGNYSAFMQKKQHEQEAVERKYINDSKELRRIEGIVEQQKRWGRERNFITAASKQKQADRIREQLVPPDRETESIRLRFEPMRTSGNDVLRVRNLSKSFDSKSVLKDVNFDLRRGERVFLIGPNGCGKTTLFKILCRQYDADFDEIEFGARVDLGYFDQMQSDLKPDNNAIEEISDAFPMMSTTAIRKALGAFLLKGDDAAKRISMLSGGERARISLLKLVLSGANLFLLDEPTNHLDTLSREALETTLTGYDGTMLIISHDRYFINKLATRILELGDDTVTEYLGNYDYYCENKREAQTPAVISQDKTRPAQNEYRLRKEAQAVERKRMSDIKKAEHRIEEIEESISATQQQLQSPEVTSDYERLIELTNKLEYLHNEQDNAYALWESLSCDS